MQNISFILRRYLLNLRVVYQINIFRQTWATRNSPMSEKWVWFTRGLILAMDVVIFPRQRAWDFRQKLTFSLRVFVVIIIRLHYNPSNQSRVGVPPPSYWTWEHKLFWVLLLSTRALLVIVNTSGIMLKYNHLYD